MRAPKKVTKTGLLIEYTIMKNKGHYESQKSIRHFLCITELESNAELIKKGTNM